MGEVIGALVGALAVIGIPLITWFSRRAAREGRLMIRVERLGGVYAHMPDSPEREVFKVHVTRAIGELNSWLDLENVKRRRLIRRISTATYLVGVVAVLIALPLVDTETRPWVTSVLGTAIGVVISVVTLSSTYFIERQARRKADDAAKNQRDAAAAERMEAIKRGEPLPAGVSHAGHGRPPPLETRPESVQRE